MLSKRNVKESGAGEANNKDTIRWLTRLSPPDCHPSNSTTRKLWWKDGRRREQRDEECAPEALSSLSLSLCMYILTCRIADENFFNSNKFPPKDFLIRRFFRRLLFLTLFLFSSTQFFKFPLHRQTSSSSFQFFLFSSRFYSCFFFKK